MGYSASRSRVGWGVGLRVVGEVAGGEGNERTNGDEYVDGDEPRSPLPSACCLCRPPPPASAAAPRSTPRRRVMRMTSLLPAMIIVCFLD